MMNDNVDPVSKALTVARALLGVPDLAECDDFFDAGMTSLIALQLANKFSEMTGRVVEVVDIYEAPTLAGLQHILNAEGMAVAPPRDDEQARLRISHAQRRFWLAEQFSPGAADNTIVLAYSLTGPLRPDLLDLAFADVVAVHPILRTRYVWQGDEVVLDVLPAEECGLAIETADRPPGLVEWGAIADHLTEHWWDTPFELDRRPPVRARLCRIDADKHLFCLQIHHIAFDGWSERLFVDDICAAYQTRLGAVSANASPMIGSPTADRDAPAERPRTDKTALAFWRRTLADAPQPFLPAPAEPTAEAERREIIRRVPANVVRRVHAATRHRRAPVLAALMAAVAQASGDTFGVSDVCLGVVTEGSRRSRSIGYFVNPLPLPLPAGSARKATDVLDDAVARLRAAMRHANVPFDELVRMLVPARGRHPWFQALVILQYERPSCELAPGTSLRPVPVHQPRTAIEWLVQAFPQPDGAWELRLAWRADGCGNAAAAAVVDGIEGALERLGAPAA